MMGGEEGTCKALTEFMQRTKGERPKDWPSYRNIDIKEPPINVDFMSEDEDAEGEGEEGAGEEESDD
jgi:hypothetical protein